jgi:hypothetical protein
MKAELMVDGKKVPMNKFVQKIIAETIRAMIETLDEVGDWKKIEIKLEKD